MPWRDWFGLVLASCALLAVTSCGATSAGPGAGASRSASTGSRPVSPAAHRQLVATARWVREPQGFRLRLQPTRSGREHAGAAPRLALDQALRIARPTPVMLSVSTRHSLLNQLRCHAVFAPNKPRWDLETWRPDVGFTKTVVAECNP